jgi:hypothetical protein
MMIQFFVFGLFIMALLAGVYSHFESSSSKSMNPLGFLFDKSGYTEMQTLNRKKAEEVNVTTSAGIMQIRRQIDDLALLQNNFVNTVKDQQQILNGAYKDASNVIIAAKKIGVAGKDILQLEALASQIQDEQRLSVAHGQQLVVLNDQLTQNRKWIANQIDLANINTDVALHELQNRNVMLKAQTAQLFDKMYTYNQQMREAMDRMREKTQDLNNAAYENSDQEHAIKEHIRHMLDKEHEDMVRLSENEKKSKNQMKDAQQNLADAKYRLNVMQQHAKDLIEDEHQKQEDQLSMIKQRLADERQRMQDHQK